MKIVFLGTGTFAGPIFKALTQEHASAFGVVRDKKVKPDLVRVAHYG